MLISKVKKLSPLGRLIYWINERQNIKDKKDLGEKAPWTDDVILQSYRFCNVIRMDDKVSQWLYHNWYKPNFDHKHIIQAVAFARFINKPATLDYLTFHMFNVKDKPAWERIKILMRTAKQYGATLFNSAYMVRGNDGQDKVASVVDYYVKGLEQVTADTDSMEETHGRLQACYGMGSFMAGQVVADLRWAMSGRWLDRKKWAPIGPGSMRGMNRLHNRPIKTPIRQDQFNDELAELIEQIIPYAPPSLKGKIEAIDVQSLLCETDKYCRVLLEEGKSPKQRYPGAAD